MEKKEMGFTVLSTTKKLYEAPQLRCRNIGEALLLQVSGEEATIEYDDDITIEEGDEVL